jgi:acyl carrier protein phosphodiesterase
MNFLAHFHLAWPEELLVVGGLEGDFHKGPLPGRLAEKLQAGVSLHRAIDAYTDSHPVVAELRREFPPELRRYAGIVIDLCFDYFLARRWATYCEVPRADFTASVYRMLDKHSPALSSGAAQMASRLQQYDILNRYQHWEMITATAQRIGQRLRHDNPLGATDELTRPLLPEIGRAFEAFYPDLVHFSHHSVKLAQTTKGTH